MTHMLLLVCLPMVQADAEDDVGRASVWRDSSVHMPSASLVSSLDSYPQPVTATVGLDHITVRSFCCNGVVFVVVAVLVVLVVVAP